MGETERAYGLGLAHEGQMLEISGLATGRNLDKRLAELGLHIGARVMVIKRDGSGIILGLDTARVAVGAGLAMKILVRDAR